MIAPAFAILALFCSQQVVLAAVAADTTETDVEVCKAETGSTYEEVVAWADGGDASENLKCMMKCVMLRGKTLTPDGRLVLEPMLEKMPEDQHTAITQCVEIEQGGELCDLAYRHMKCFRDKSPQFYAQHVKSKLPASS